MAENDPAPATLSSRISTIESTLASFFTSSPFSKVFEFLFGTTFLTVLGRLSVLLFASGTVLYGRPYLFGIVLCIFAIASIVWEVRIKKLSTGWIALPSILFLFAVLIFVFHGPLLRFELEHVSSYDVKPTFMVGSQLDDRTLSKSTHGGIVLIKLEADTISRKTTSPRLVSVEDRSDWDGDKAIDAEVCTLYKLFPRDTNGSLTNSLTFLVGPAGTGKATILRQWVYALTKARCSGESFFKHTFLLTPADIGPLLTSQKTAGKPSSLQDALAAAYSGIVGSSEYFDLLLLNQSCLVVISDWDQIGDKSDRLGLLKKIADLVANDKRYHVSVLIGSRPDVLFRDFSIEDANNFLYERYLQRLVVHPLGEEERALYFRRKELPFVPTRNYEQVEHLINSAGPSSGVARSLSTRLEFLNLMVEQADDIQGLDSFTLCRRVITRTLKRDPRTASDEFYKSATSTMHHLAFDASQHDTDNLEFSGRLSQADDSNLKDSPVVDVTNGHIVFTPPIVNSYFAVEGLLDALSQPMKSGTKRPIYTQTLLREIAQFCREGQKTCVLPPSLANVKVLPPPLAPGPVGSE